MLSPKINDAFSSSKIKDLNCPYKVFDGEFPGTIELYNKLPLPSESQ